MADDVTRTPVEDPHTPLAVQNIRLAIAGALIDQMEHQHTSSLPLFARNVAEAVLIISDAVINGRGTDAVN